MRRLITSAILTALVTGVAASASIGAVADPPHASAANASRLTADVAAGRLATAKYVNNLA